MNPIVEEPTMRFIDMLLLHCLLKESPPDTLLEIAALSRNQHLVAGHGRNPSLVLDRDGKDVPLTTWAAEVLDEFAAIAAVPEVALISLQHGFGTEQIATVPFASSIHRLPDNIDQSGGAFIDTAAIMKNLDLVITTDTSTAHLAGALGVPVWLILGKVPDWRWLEQGETTPWYPTLRLFRQAKMGDWSGVMHSIAVELNHFIA